MAAAAAAVAIGERQQVCLLKREVEGARKHALCGGPPFATCRHHLQKSTLSSTPALALDLWS